MQTIQHAIPEAEGMRIMHISASLREFGKMCRNVPRGSLYEGGRGEQLLHNVLVQRIKMRGLFGVLKTFYELTQSGCKDFIDLVEHVNERFKLAAQASFHTSM